MIVGPCRIVTGGPEPAILEDAGVRVVGAHVAQVGPMAVLAASHANEVRWPGGGRLMLPGSVNAHAHLARHLARGLGLASTGAWERYDRALAPDDVYWGTLAALVEGLRHGVTTVFDLHRSSSCLDLSLSEVTAAAARAGVRVATGYAMAEEDGPAERRAALAESVGLARDLERRAEGRLRSLVALRAATLEGLGGLLEPALEAAGTSLGVQAELMLDATPASRWRAPKSATSLLWAHAERAPRALLLEARERGDALSASGPVVGALGRELDLAWGSDAGVNAPPQAAVIADRAVFPEGGGESWYRRTYLNGARWAARWFGEGLGTIDPGAPADLVLVDYHPPTPMEGRTLAAHLAQGAGRAAASGVMVAGEILMDRGTIVAVDEAEVAARARECAGRLWRRLG